MLSERWKGDHIAFLGDEFSVSSQETNEVLRMLYEQSIELGYGGDITDMMIDEYRNVSCLFMAAEKEVREEIGYYLEDLKDTSTGLNYYKIDPSDPYKGLFLMTGREYVYTINYSKGIYYSFAKTKFINIDKTEEGKCDPLPLLLRYGRASEPGLWLGDIIGVSDTAPEDFRLIKVMHMNYFDTTSYEL